MHFDFIAQVVKSDAGCFYVRKRQFKDIPVPTWLEDVSFCEFGTNADLRKAVTKAWKKADKPIVRVYEYDHSELRDAVKEFASLGV